MPASAPNSKANQALIAACKMEDADAALAAAKTAIKGRANIEATDERGATALYCAVEYGHVALAEFLLEKGANRNPPMIASWFNSLRELADHYHGHGKLYELFVPDEIKQAHALARAESKTGGGPATQLYLQMLRELDAPTNRRR